MNADREIGVHFYVGGEKNAYGIPAPVWQPPLNEPGTVQKVYGWAPKGSAETGPATPINVVTTELDLYAPAGFLIAPEDVIDLPEGQFQVVGHPADYGTGPFGTSPGVVVTLKRWE